MCWGKLGASGRELVGGADREGSQSTIGAVKAGAVGSGCGKFDGDVAVGSSTAGAAWLGSGEDVAGVKTCSWSMAPPFTYRCTVLDAGRGVPVDDCMA